MKKSSINPLPDFFDKYINLVDQDDLFDGFSHSIKTLDSLDLDVYSKIEDKRYQSDKWSVKDIIQHVIDNERIQSYRALRFARMDLTTLPGYDEKLFGQNANASKKKIKDLITELKTLRTSTVQLFDSFEKNSFGNSGICFNQNISVLALGFVIIGHQIHHLKVIEEKYMPLI